MKETAEQSQEHSHGESEGLGMASGGGAFASPPAFQLSASNAYSMNLSSAPLQLRTDMEQLADTQALPEFQEEGGALSVQEAIDARHGEVERDANYSNLDKRQFEEQLARIIMLNPGAVMDPLLKVSRNILAYLRRKEELFNTNLLESFTSLDAGANTLGRTGFDPTVEGFSAQMGSDILSDASPASLPTHLNIHGKFYGNIYREDYLTEGEDGTRAAQIAAGLEGVTSGAVADMAGDEAQQDGYHPLNTFQPDDMFSNDHADATLGRPRRRVPDADRTPGVGDHGNMAGQISGLAPVPGGQELIEENEVDGRPTHAHDPHNRGIDIFYIDEVKRWAQNARIVLDMPLSAGPSGSTAFMLSGAKEMGLGGGEELKQYVAALIGSLVGGGHHTFHEVMTIARIAGIQYVDGDYGGVYPESLQATDAYRDLAERYPQYLGGGGDAQQEQAPA